MIPDGDDQTRRQINAAQPQLDFQLLVIASVLITLFAVAPYVDTRHQVQRTRVTL